MIRNNKQFYAILAVIALAALVYGMPRPANTSPPSQSWTFNGAFGTYDRAAARRGFQVYSEGCAPCHSMNFLHYRDLTGIGFTDEEIKTIAAAVQVPSGIDSQGNVVLKPGTPASRFRAPFFTEDAAREALNGSLPPDLSLATKTDPAGPNYVFALLTGYGDPPAGTTVADGMFWNRWFAGHQIAMPPPLVDDRFTFADGTKSTVAQNAHDVVTFLAWAANPEMEQRKHLGFSVVLYFVAIAGLTWLVKRRLWGSVH